MVACARDCVIVRENSVITKANGCKDSKNEVKAHCLHFSNLANGNVTKISIGKKFVSICTVKIKVAR